ncbi:MAG: DinB family protein [bacterium]
MTNLQSDFETTVGDGYKRLSSIPEEKAACRPGPGKWSAKEIVGHLIDSACNNHRRFVIAQTKDDLIFDGYDQERWVRVQDYQSRPWPELVLLWAAYNRQLVHLVSCIPPEVLTKPRARHSLDQIAWKKVPADTPTTLEYLIRDYLGHMQMHLEQIRQQTT